MNHEENVLDLDAQEYWRQRAMSAMHENDAIQQENRDEIDRLRRRCKDLQFECGMMRAGTADIIRQYILAYQKKREANQQRLQGELDLNKSRLAQAISALKNPPTSGKPQSVTPGTVARLKGSIKRIMRELAANDPETIPVDVVLKQLYHFSDGLIEDVVSKRKRNRRHADDDEEVEDAAAGEEDGVDDGRDDSEGSEPSSPPIQRRRDDLGNAFVKARIKRPARVRNRRVGQGETAHVVGTRSGSVASTASSADQEDERPVQVAQENTLEPVNGALAEATYENPDGRLLGNPVQTQGEAVNLLDAQQQHYDASTVPLVENGYADPSQPQEQQQQQEELNHVEFAEEPHAAAEHHTEDYPEQYRQEGVEVQSMPQREELYVEREHNNWEQVMMEAEAEAEAAADNAAEQTYDYEPAMDSLSNALRETPGVTHHVQHVAISTGPTFEEQVTETDDEAQQSATVPATTTTAAPLTPVTAVTQSLQTLRVSTVSPISTPLPTMQADPVNTTQASQPVQPRTPSRIGRCRNARTSPAPRHSSPRLPPPQSSAFYRTTAPLQSWHRMMKRTRAQYEGWEPLDTSDAEDGDENVTTVKAPRAIRSVAGVASHAPNGGALQRQNSAHTLRDDEETSRRTAQDSEDEFLRQPLPPSHFLAYQ